MRIAPLVGAVFAGLFALTLMLGSWYTVDERERGVILRNGAIVGEASPGLHFKLPLIDSVIDVPVDTRVVTIDKMAAYSRDQQPAEIRMSVVFSIPPSDVREVYSRFRDLDGLTDRVIKPKVFEQTKNVFGQYTAVSAIQERTKLNSDMASAIFAGIKALDAPVTIESVQIENIDFSDAYEKSIEQRMLAEVEVQKLRQNAEREKVQAEIVVTQATAQANAVRAKAQAEADAIRLRGDAEAQAIKARGDALRENPGLVALTQAERWDGKLPSTMVPGSSVPMLNLGGGR